MRSGRSTRQPDPLEIDHAREQPTPDRVMIGPGGSAHQVLLEGIGRRPEIPAARHGHHRTQQAVPATRRHLQFVVDPGSTSEVGEGEPVAAAEGAELGHDPDAAIQLELLEPLAHPAESSQVPLEHRSWAGRASCHRSRRADRRVPARERGTVDDRGEHGCGRSRDLLAEAQDRHKHYRPDRRNANGAVSKIVRTQAMRPSSTPSHSTMGCVPAGVLVTMS
jgi:hypothetical protein